MQRSFVLRAGLYRLIVSVTMATCKCENKVMYVDCHGNVISKKRISHQWSIFYVWFIWAKANTKSQYKYKLIFFTTRVTYANSKLQQPSLRPGYASGCCVLMLFIFHFTQNGNLPLRLAWPSNTPKYISHMYVRTYIHTYTPYQFFGYVLISTSNLVEFKFSFTNSMKSKLRYTLQFLSQES